MAAVIVRRIRRSLRRQRVFRDRRNPLDLMDDDELYVAFRFRRHDLLDLCNELVADIELLPRHGMMPPIMQVMLFNFSIL